MDVELTVLEELNMDVELTVLEELNMDVEVSEEVKVPILLEVLDLENEILEDEDPNVVLVDKYVDELEILVVPLSDNKEYPDEVEISLIEIVSLGDVLSDGEFDIVL
jgi:hypothetical protein